MLFVLDSNDIAKAGAIVVLGMFTNHTPTEDAQLFEKACGSEMGTCMSDELDGLSSKFKAPAQAMPTLVNISPATKNLPAERRKQLAAKWAHWFGSEKDWRHCSLSSTHRPSLGSWVGMPWDDAFYAHKAIGRDKPASIQFAMQFGNKDMLRAMKPKLGILEEPLWSRAGSGGTGTASTAAPSLAAIKAYIQQAVEAARAKKGASASKGAPAAKKAAKAAPAAKPASKAGPKKAAASKVTGKKTAKK